MKHRVPEGNLLEKALEMLRGMASPWGKEKIMQSFRSHMKLKGVTLMRWKEDRKSENVEDRRGIVVSRG